MLSFIGLLLFLSVSSTASTWLLSKSNTNCIKMSCIINDLLYSRYFWRELILANLAKFHCSPNLNSPFSFIVHAYQFAKLKFANHNKLALCQILIPPNIPSIRYFSDGFIFMHIICHTYMYACHCYCLLLEMLLCRQGKAV